MSSTSGGGGASNRMAYRRNASSSRKWPRHDATNYYNYGQGQSGKWSEGDYDVTYSEVGSSAFERTTMAKYLHKILRNNDIEKCIHGAKQLQTYLYTSDAVKTVPRYLDEIFTMFHDILSDRPPKGVRDEIVCCIGLVGYVLSPNFDRYLQWIFSEAKSISNDAISSLYYRALLQTLKYDKKKELMQNHIPEILANLQSCIENADTPLLLMGSMDAVLYLSQQYPHIFSTHFRDTVDILVGWHIDCTQKSEVIQYTSQALIGLQAFWVADINFSFTLLGQFLEDMEAYTEDLTIAVTGEGITDEEMPRPDECIAKICSLMRVFTTVMMSLGDHISCTDDVTPHFLSDVLIRTIHCSQSIMQCVYSGTLLTATYNCITLVLKQLSPLTPCISETVIPFLTTQVQCNYSPPYNVSSALLELLKQVIDKCNTQLPVSFITDLFTPDTLLYSLRHANNKQVLSDLLAVYHSIMGLKNVPLLEEAYRHVVGDIQIAYNTLLQHAGDTARLSIIDDNPLVNTRYTVCQARIVASFDLCVLTEIGNTKNNLIGMWALSPSIFQLFCTHLQPLNATLMQWYPAIQYSALYTLYSHCARHENFVSSSDLLSRRQFVEGSLLANVSPPTSGQLGIILDLLGSLLHNNYCSYDARNLCLKWIGEVVKSLKASPHVYIDPKFITIILGLIHNGYSKETCQSVNAAQCLKTIFINSTNIPRHLTVKCVELCMTKLSSTDAKISSIYLELLACLPLDVVIASNNMTYIESQRSDNEPENTLYNMAAAQRAYMARVSPKTFNSHDFSTIMPFLLNQKPIRAADRLWWLENLYHSSQRADKDASPLTNIIDGNSNMLWWWACWEAAQFCVMSRLKTPLGKPQATFTKIEGVLIAYSQQARGSNSHTLQSHTKDGDLYSSRSPVVLLLQFLEYLEKLLYNAYEGCAVSLPLVPKVVRTFFRTNRATCQEWLVRIRQPAILVALHAGLPAVAVHHATQLLTHLHKHGRSHTTEFEQALVYYARSVSALPGNDALPGVDTWCREVVGRRFAWMKPLIAMARGSYEDARTELKSIVKMDTGQQALIRGGDTVQTPPTHVSSFLIDQVTESYMKLADWTGVAEWIRACDNFHELNGNRTVDNFLHPPSLQYIKEMASFDGMTLNMEDSLVGEDSTLTPSGIAVWDLRWCVERSHSKLIESAMLLEKVYTDTKRRDEVTKSLKHVIESTSQLLQIPATHWPLTVYTHSLVHLTAASLLSSLANNDISQADLLPLSREFQLEPKLHDLTPMLHIERLVSYQRQLPFCTNQTDISTQLMTIQITVARLCRKQHNVLLAEKFLRNNIELLLRDNHDVSIDSDDLLASVYNLRHSVHSDKSQIVKVERESAKLLYAMGRSKDALELLLNSVVDDCDVSSSDNSRGDDSFRNYTTNDDSGLSAAADRIDKNIRQRRDDRHEIRQMNARSMLHIQKWLYLDQKYLASLQKQTHLDADCSSQVYSTVKHIKALLKQQEMGNVDFVTNEPTIVDSGVLSDCDGLLGRLLHLATIEAPDLAKCWFTFANWCYKWGRKAIDNSSHGMVDLTEEELVRINEILPHTISDHERSSVVQLLSQIIAPGASEDDIIDQTQLSYSDGSDPTQRQHLIASIPSHSHDEELINSLHYTWKRVIARVYHYYQLSARSYFTYLQLNGEAGESSEDGNVVATLRLLRLLVKHAWELRDVIEDNLSRTPTAPWKGIIPQLFSRLSHPEGYVRQAVCDLLCRVSQDAPHLIVYPAVVGCTSLAATSPGITQPGILSSYLGESDDEEQTTHDDESNVADNTQDQNLQSCLAAIVDSLTHYNPQMIGDVQQFVQELRRITLLWDELWLGSLNQHHADTMRRITRLEAEVSKVVNNPSLGKDERAAIIREKHKTIMKPIVYAMERVQAIITQPAETPHEQWFQQTYAKQISDALNRLRDPPNPSLPQSSWALFKQIHHSLQQRSQKRGSFMLQMKQVSPTLASLSGTVIPMSGLSSAAQSVTVSAIQNNIQILPTKTKPKKLIINGSDGKKYTYLFKGLEDLHLDERIMQLLSIINNMLATSNRGSQIHYRARHYAVTPLGPRSGLIQWVDGATPLFGLYKRWQQRELHAQTYKSGASNPSTNVPRPSDVYYSKLRPVLQEKGISTREENRRDWPVSILKHVLTQLLEDTPNDLLAKELWCSSVNAQDWWHTTQVYSVSTAVMSMLGYIIGLGDRHLDNVLVNLSTGEVIHIDYNVCFEKGKTLRVPEKVPCRLTQNIVGALGLTGIEGTFRIACEHVLKTMRKGRETLLTLLEAFLYDPLVDWTTGSEDGLAGAFYGGGAAVHGQNEGQQAKKDLDRNITQSMFSIRIAEMKSAWFINKDELLSCFGTIEAALNSWLEANSEFTRVQKGHDSLLELKFTVKDAIVDLNHSIYSLARRYHEYSMVEQSKADALILINTKMEECQGWSLVHERVVMSGSNGTFQRMYNNVSASLNPGLPPFMCAIDFLQGAGQAQVVTQCEEIEHELTKTLNQRHAVLATTLDILNTYISVTGHFRQFIVTENRIWQYSKWLSELLADFNSLKCMQLIDAVRNKYMTTASLSSAQSILSTELKLQAIVTDSNARLAKLVERRAQDSSSIEKLACLMQESSDNISNFIQDNGSSGAYSMVAVILTALCQLDKRYLVMEGAAAAAGDRLMNLTSRQGDWFLDELCGMSSNVMQLLDILKQITTDTKISMSQSLEPSFLASHSIYRALHEMNLNFRVVILPEALKTMQSNDASINMVLHELEVICTEANRPMDSLLSQLEVQHRNAIMDIESDTTDVTGVVDLMKQRFNDLIQGPWTDADHLSPGQLTPGQMLLMAFNGLFTTLDNEFTNMITCLEQSDIPASWCKIDIIKEAKSLQISSFSGQAKVILSDMFFVKRLLTMKEFLGICKQFAETIHGESGVCFDDEQLSKPVKKFIAEYVRMQVLGFPSQIVGYIVCTYANLLNVDVTAKVLLRDIGAEYKVPVEELCKEAIDTSIKLRLFHQHHVTQASVVLSNHDSAWRKHDWARRLDENQMLVENCVERVRMELARYQWIHEESLSSVGHQARDMLIPSHSDLMADLQKCMQTIVNHDSSITNCLGRYTQLESGITQRLKWAAGANHTLNTVMQTYDDAVTFRQQALESESKLSTEVVGLCQGVLHLETYRNRTAEAQASDANIISLLQKCEESCLLEENRKASVSDVELRIMKLESTPACDKVNAAWLHNTLATLKQEVKKSNETMSGHKLSLNAAETKVSSAYNEMRSILSSHHKLMLDVRKIVVSLDKYEKQDSGSDEVIEGGVSEWLASYREFTDNIAATNKLFGEKQCPENITRIMSMLASVKAQIARVYDDLVAFASPLVTDNNQDDPRYSSGDKKGSDSVMKRSFEADSMSPQPTKTSIVAPVSAKKTEKVTRDPRTGKAVQGRNMYAMGIWRRVKMKLEGKDPDINKRLSVPEQVDFVLREATSLDNLAVLYEGWTPWV